MSATKEIPVNVVGEDLEFTISASVHRIWKRFQQHDKKSLEACGILIGGYSSDYATIHVERFTMPGKLDRRSRHGFLLISPHHQKAADKANKESNGEDFYIGTWHTHPCTHPTPSRKDLRDWKKCIKRNKVFELFAFAIVGTESVSLYLYRN